MVMIGSQKGSIKGHDLCTVYSRFNSFHVTWGLSAFDGSWLVKGSQVVYYPVVVYPTQYSFICLHIFTPFLPFCACQQHINEGSLGVVMGLTSPVMFHLTGSTDRPLCSL